MKLTDATEPLSQYCGGAVAAVIGQDVNGKSHVDRQISGLSQKARNARYDIFSFIQRRNGDRDTPSYHLTLQVGCIEPHTIRCAGAPSEGERQGVLLVPA
jgi:hypothetical protein